MENVTIPAAVRTIGNEAFIYSSLKTITFQDDVAAPSQLTSIGERAFAHVSLETLALPRSVTTIGAEFIDYNKALASLSFGAKVSAESITSATPRRPP